MKSNYFFTFVLLFFLNFINLFSQELKINSSKVKYNDGNKITIFEGNVNTEDDRGNKLFSSYAEYDKINKIIRTQGDTKIITSGGYIILGSNIIFDNKNRIIQSSYKTQITDKDGNRVLVDMFDYSILTNIFFSKGKIELLDVNNNSYSFSEIYIDENKKKIIGSDAKVFIKQEDLLLDKNNDPRFFANTMSLSNNVTTFQKGVFTYCKNRGEDKCPPWALESKKIKHDLAKKIIYYENVVLKVYDFPIFYAPIFSHPDPTVKRMSGFLAPTLTNNNTLGSGFRSPYYWNIANDRDLTFGPKLYLGENPLMLAEYRQDFKNSSLIVDVGYTKGYKKTTNKKTSGGRAHFFSNFNYNFINEVEKNSDLDIKIQRLSNDTYLKVYDVDTTIVSKNLSVLENVIDYSYNNKDFNFSLAPSVYEKTNREGNSRYEYLLPSTLEKNIISDDKYGLVDFKSNLLINNTNTNKQTNLFVNDFSWKSNNWASKLGFENRLEALVKNVNYETRNKEEYKNDELNSELNSAFGYFAKLPLYKNDIFNKNFHTLTPKLLLRYAPGHMRDISSAASGRLDYVNLFNLKKTSEIDVLENGLSTSLGFEYKKSKLDKQNSLKEDMISLSVGQVIANKENMDIPSASSLDQKFSDIVGVANYYLNKKVNLNYNFSIDQNYKTLNYNEVGADFNFNDTKFNLSYLEEKNHIGNQESIKTGLDYKLNNSNELSFSTKRNLLTNSAEFYNLSYNYINDCLKAGIAYRREFYTDRDIEPVNNLMFTISVLPFGQVKSPSFSK